MTIVSNTRQNIFAGLEGQTIARYWIWGGEVLQNSH